jgi:sugar (pentulose or hexulose) kinase
MEIRELNPTAPTMRSFIKLHKENRPIRPVINWRNAPGYKLATKIAEILTTYIPLPFTYNVKNTIQLMNELTDIP